eukprot:5688120-Amphidinium_carterae.1
MNRHLEDVSPDQWDVYLAHHVLVPNAEAHGTETFACGGVNCRERLSRSTKRGPSICEHAECGLDDTPVHRLLSCTATSAARTKAGWTSKDSERVTTIGFSCAHYGF